MTFLQARPWPLDIGAAVRRISTGGSVSVRSHVHFITKLLPIFVRISFSTPRRWLSFPFAPACAMARRRSSRFHGRRFDPKPAPHRMELARAPPYARALDCSRESMHLLNHAQLPVCARTPRLLIYPFNPACLFPVIEHLADRQPRAVPARTPPTLPLRLTAGRSTPPHQYLQPCRRELIDRFSCFPVVARSSHDGGLSGLVLAFDLGLGAVCLDLLAGRSSGGCRAWPSRGVKGSPEQGEPAIGRTAD
jgi:hypothetical protein